MIDLPLNVDFSGKVAVVTDASGVLCGTMARAFAQAGAKVAVSNFTQWLATHFAGTGIRCNAIAPGFPGVQPEPEAAV